MIGQGVDWTVRETRRSSDLAMRRETRVSIDVGDDDLGALPGRPPASGMVVLDPGEVLEDLVVWTARTAQERDRGPGPSRPGRAAIRQ